MKKLLLTIAVMLGTITASAHDIEVDGLYYNFNSDGSVSITFKGNNCDAYTGEYSGKVVIPSTIEYDKVNYSVTAVGTYAFFNCSELTSVTIPASITVLEDYSFNGCSNLSEIIIEDCAESLSAGYSNIYYNTAGFRVTNPLFKECTLETLYLGRNIITTNRYPNLYSQNSPFQGTTLESVTMGDNVTELRYSLFSGSALKSVKLSENLATIGNSAFSGTNITEIIIPNSVTSIGESAFQYCEKLKTIELSDCKITELRKRTFQYCSSLESIILPEGLTDIGGERVFEHCVALKTVSLPSTTSFITSGVFSYCDSIIEVTSLNPTPPYLGSSFTSAVRKNAILYVPVGASEAYKSADNWLMFKNIQEIGASDDNNEPVFNGIYYKIISEEEQTVAVTFRGETSTTYENEYSGEIVIPETVTLNGKTYTVTEIGDEAFAICTELTSVTIPNSVKRVNSYAFYGCANLTSVTLPESYEYLGGLAFAYVPAFTSVTLPNTLTSMGYGVFKACPNLYEIKVAEGLDWLYSVDGALFYYTMLVQYPAGKTDSVYSIPDNVITIADYAFESCKNLTNIDIPESVTEIGYMAFYDCSALKSITCNATIPPTIEYAYVFYGIDVTIPLYVPAGCKSLYESTEVWKDFTNIIEMEEVSPGIDGIYYKIISEEEQTVAVTFRGETSTTYKNEYSGEIVIPETVTLNGKTYTVTEIGDEAFLSCKELTSVIIPNSVKRIDFEAFYGCSNLTSVTLPESYEYLGMDAFAFVPAFTSVTLPNTLTSMGYGAFRACPNLYEIKVAEGLTWLSSVDGILFYNNESVLIQYPVGRADSIYTIPNTVTTIAPDAFYGCSNLTNINIPETVTTIDRYAFMDCHNLEQITIPSSVTYIGHQGFSYCSALKSITCKATTPPTLVSYVFYGTDVTIPLYVPVGCKSSYEVADQWKDFTNIIEMEPEGVDTENICIDGIYYRILSEDELTAEVKYKGGSYNEYANEYTGDIVIPATITVSGKTYTVTEIGYGSFRECEITSIVIPNTVTMIRGTAFQYCTRLKTVVIPNSVKEIQDLAFYYCTNLTEVSIPEEITAIASYAFTCVPAFTSLTLPKTLEYFGAGAFCSCPNLYEINVADDSRLCSIDGVLFTKSQQFLLQYPAGNVNSNYSIPNTVLYVQGGAFAGCDNLINVNIPESVTTIRGWAFDKCSKLNQITIPSTVTTIEDCAFRYCYAVKSMTCKATIPPTLTDSEVLYGIDKNIPLYVPIGCKSSYETAEVWKEFTNIQEVDFSSIESINIDCNEGDIEYYNLNGVKVADDNLSSGFYIKRQNGKSTKIFVK